MTGIRVDFVLSRVLAIVVPLGLLAFGIDHLAATQTFDQKRQLDNAGQVLNGEVLSIPVNTAIHKRMSRGPELVLIGNSFANTNVQISVLGKLLGMDKGRSTRLSIPNTIGAHWYALLKHRVFRPEYEAPDVIVIVSDLQSALLNEPLSEGSYRNLLTLMDGDDPVISARVEQKSSFLWDTVLENRAKVRRNAINTVRDASARRVLGRPRGKKIRRATNDAMDRVFHASKTDLSLRVAAMPVSVGEESGAIDLSDLPRPRDSFLPQIARLCHENGARLVMVRNRESPLMPRGQGDLVPESFVKEARAAVEEWGGLLLEMDPIAMVDAHYDNLDHMTEDGSRRFTIALAEAFDDIGITGERDRYVRPAKPDTVDLPTANAASDIASIRRSWSQLDARQIARWTFDEGWTGAADTFRVRGVFEPIDGSAHPILRVADREARFQELPSGRWVAELSGEPPKGPWSLEVEAGDNPVVIEGLELGTGSTPLYLSGYRPDVHGHRLELLGRVEVLNGELYRDAVEPTFAAPPPKLSQINKNRNQGPGPSAFFDAPRLRPLSDTNTRPRTPLTARCSPLRIAENGELLPIANVGCKEVREFGKGRTCHTDRRVFFTASDATHPVRNGRRYRAVYDPERACDGGFWLYPKDVATLDVPPARLRELRDGVSALEVDIKPIDVRDGAYGVRMTVLVDGTPRLTHLFDDSVVETRTRLALDPPAPPDAEVAIRFDNAEGSVFAIVNRVALLPPPIVWGAFGPVSSGSPPGD